MNCRRVVNLISAYVDGELTGAEMLDIRSHLRECPDCAEEYESIRATKLMVARLNTITPRADLAASIMHRLNQINTPPHQRALSRMSSYLARKLSPVVAALAVSGMAFAFLAIGGQSKLVSNNDVMANAPIDLHAQQVSLVPEMPESAMLYSNSAPLVVANEMSQGASLRMVDFTVR
ncbi:MAG: anti-sigma factor family protein [Armatimonadota bacterium]|jgi:anti-sigma factor RsiW